MIWAENCRSHTAATRQIRISTPGPLTLHQISKTPFPRLAVRQICSHPWPPNRIFIDIFYTVNLGCFLAQGARELSFSHQDRFLHQRWTPNITYQGSLNNELFKYWMLWIMVGLALGPGSRVQNLFWAGSRLHGPGSWIQGPESWWVQDPGSRARVDFSKLQLFR